CCRPVVRDVWRSRPRNLCPAVIQRQSNWRAIFVIEHLTADEVVTSEIIAQRISRVSWRRELHRSWPLHKDRTRYSFTRKTLNRFRPEYRNAKVRSKCPLQLRLTHLSTCRR